MSLVHEALQKAEREKQRQTGVAPVATRPQPTPAPVAMAPISRASITPAPVKSVVVVPAPQKSAPAFLSVMIACVAVVAMVAIVYLVSQAITANRRAPVVAGEGEAPAESKPNATGSTAARPEPHPPAATETPVPADDTKFKVSGIMKDPEGKYCAVLNGRVVYETYFQDGATVKRIERDRVTLEVGGREVVARLF